MNSKRTFFLNKNVPRAYQESFPYNTLPSEWLASRFNAFHNTRIKRQAEAHCRKEIRKYLSGDFLTDSLGMKPLQRKKNHKVSVLGSGATADVVLVKDVEQNNELFAVKIFHVVKLVEKDVAATYTRLATRDKLKGTTSQERWRIKLKRRQAMQLHDGRAESGKDETNEEILAALIAEDVEVTLKSLKCEIELLKKLQEVQSPYVVRLYGSFIDVVEKDVYVTMEFCDTSLAHFVDNGKTLGVVELQSIAISVLLGIGKVHALGYVFFDLKPENILVKKDGSVKLCDFGSAFRLDDTRSNITHGTVRFYSPELQYVFNEDSARLEFHKIDGITTRKDFFESERELIKKCDIWALGMTMLILAAGEVAFASLFISKWCWTWDDVLYRIIYHMDENHDQSTFLDFLTGDKVEGDAILERLEVISVDPDENTLEREFKCFLNKCLTFDRSLRASTNELYHSGFVNFKSGFSILKSAVEETDELIDVVAKLREPIRRLMSRAR